MSAVACFAEPNLGRKIPGAARTSNSGEVHRENFLAAILTASRCETVTILDDFQVMRRATCLTCCSSHKFRIEGL